MKKIKTSLLTLGATLIAATSIMAASAYMDPVGAVIVNTLASSDTWCAVPFTAAPSYVGTVASVTGNVITVSGSPAWATNVWQNAYYCLIGIKSGTPSAREGLMYTITANDAGTLTLDLASAGGANIDAGAVPVGCQIKINAFLTLDTLFPDTDASAVTPPAGIEGSAGNGLAARKTQILVPDVINPGTDLSSAAIYYYNTNTAAPGAGWRKSGASGTLAGGTTLVPDQYFIIRQSSTATDLNLPLAGTVIMPQFQTFLATMNDTTDQDIPVSFNVPLDQTLAQSKLFESGAFVGSAGNGLAARKDQLLVVDNTSVNTDKAAAFIYYYNTNTAAPGAGWRLSGASGVIADNTVVFTAGTGFIIRKKSATGSSNPVYWAVRNTYNSQP